MKIVKNLSKIREYPLWIVYFHYVELIEDLKNKPTRKIGDMRSQITLPPTLPNN